MYMDVYIDKLEACSVSEHQLACTNKDKTFMKCSKQSIPVKILYKNSYKHRHVLYVLTMEQQIQ